MMSNILLSICIPTFNRARYLDICLDSFCKQLKTTGYDVELIVIDNYSTDHTAEVVARYKQENALVQYYKNEKNVGADGNMLKCLENANGEYCWIFGDDDILLQGGLALILQHLSLRIYGLVYLDNYWFSENYQTEKPSEIKPPKALVYSDKKAFLRKVNIWVTFISAVIFRKEIVKNKDLASYIGTNLIQLQWVLPSVFAQKKCLYLQGWLVACKGNNTGGYGLFKTFGNNLNDLVNELVIRQLVPDYTPAVINYYIIKDFMPLYCIRYKQKQLTGFEDKAPPFKQLRKLYKKYFIYWVVLFPLEILPVFLGKKYYYGMRMLKLL